MPPMMSAIALLPVVTAMRTDISIIQSAPQESIAGLPARHDLRDASTSGSMTPVSPPNVRDSVPANVANRKGRPSRSQTQS